MAEQEDRDSRQDIGRMLALLVHDLRNPCATVSANVDFIKSVELPDPDSQEAMEDIAMAVDDLKHGLELMSWIARWMTGEAALAQRNGDVVEAVRRAAERASGKLTLALPEEPMPAEGGARAGDILAILLDNAWRHVRRNAPEVKVFREDGEVVVRLVDAGMPLAEEFRGDAFRIATQGELKGRPDGRYGRYCGLVAAQAAADALGGRMVAGGEEGAAYFELRLRALVS